MHKILFLLFLIGCHDAPHFSLIPPTVQENADISVAHASEFDLLTLAGFHYQPAQKCFMKSAQWGSYCLKIIADQEVSTHQGAQRFFYLEGAPFINTATAAGDLPRAVSLVSFRQVDGKRWQTAYSDFGLFTLSAPQQMGIPKFHDFGGGHYGFIQHLSFLDARGVYREKILISYTDAQETDYLVSDTAINTAKATQKAVCDPYQEAYNMQKCEREATVMLSTIDFAPHTVANFYPINVNCHGSHLGQPINCSYQLQYMPESNGYRSNRDISFFQQP